MNVKRTEGEGFYSYLWLRRNGTPYYVGKGRGRRARVWHGHIHKPKDPTGIVMFPMDSEELAFESERALISLFGRLNNGTGILRNLTDGGEGFSGGRHSEEFRRRISERHRGNKYNVGRASHFKGKKLSEEHKHKLSVAAKARAPRIGRKASEEARRKMSEAHKAHWALPEMQAERLRLSRALRIKPLHTGHKGGTPWNKGKRTKCAQQLSLL